eukprot:565897-Alexandrium_andersonii.AAC.1
MASVWPAVVALASPPRAAPPGRFQGALPARFQAGLLLLRRKLLGPLRGVYRPRTPPVGASGAGG